MSGGSGYRRLLRVEPLEDRRLLANVTVSNLNDVVNGNTGSIPLLIGNPGADGISLREAVTAANADAAADTIDFSVEGQINLSSAGQLSISKSLTINGPGSILLTIRAYDPSGAVGDGNRVFEINDGTAGLINATISGMSITGGDLGAAGVGAAVWNRGENLTINSAVLSNNHTQHIGGAIGSNSSGTVTLSNCTITGNTAGTDSLKYGGGVYAGAATDGTPGQLILLATNISNNSAGKGGGIAARVPATIAGGTISSNTAILQGGGIWAPSSSLTISGSTISGNSTVGQGGGVYGNYVSVSYTTVSGNSVTGTISSGGGLAGKGTITSSTFSGNSSASGGGGVAGGFDIVNSTISGNTAALTGGGIYRSPSESIVIRHSTISGNTAPLGAGSGIASPAASATQKVQLQSSIVAGNTNSDVDLVSGTQATVESLGHNLVGSGNAIGAFSAASGDKIGLNPMLGPLANNGGSTMTRALLTGSPAIDAGNPSAVAGSGTVPLYDQRHAPHGRVQGARIDIGAFESAPVVPSLPGDYNRDSAVNAADYVFWRKYQGTTGWVAYAGPDGSGNGTIDTPDRTVWRENIGEIGGGGGGTDSERVVGQRTGNNFGSNRRQIIVIGPDSGNTSVPIVKIVDRESGDILKEFSVYESTFLGGVRIATGNMDGDAMGIDEIIVAPGQGRVGEVRVFTQAGVELTQFRTLPYGSAYKGGVEVAVGDVNGDGRNDIVTTNSHGRTDVRVFYNNFNPAQPQLDPILNTPSKQFFVFPSSFLGGADVIVADMGRFLNGATLSATTPDGKSEIIVGNGPGMRSTIYVYDVSGTPTVVDTILPFSNTFRGGITLSAARVNSDAIPDLIVAAGNLGGSAAEIWSGLTNDATDVRLSAFTTFANTTTRNMPVHAAAIDSDSDGDGDADVIAVVQGTNGTSNQIRFFSTSGTLLATLHNFVGPWNIATLTGIDPNLPLTGGFTITLVMSGLSTSQQVIFNQAAARWSQIITGDLPNATYQGQLVDDVLIAASAIPIDGPGNTLGQANWDERRPGNGLPFHGVMEFDTADIAREEQEGTLFSTVLHEMAHVFGFGTLWEELGLLLGAGTANPIFTGAQATAAFNQIFGTTAAGVPVHNADGPGSRDSHWLESLFQNELMTPFGLIEPLSRVSVASLADLGYSVNLAAADPYTKPAGVSTFLVQPSTSSGSNSTGSSRFYARADTAQVRSPIVNSLPSRLTATSVQPVRRPALSAAATRFDNQIVDAALTAAYQRGSVKKSDDVFVRDKTDVAEFSLVNANDQFFARLGASLPGTNAMSTASSKYQ